MNQEEQTSTSGVYFHSLEGFRAVAVTLVLLQHHTLLSKTYLGVEFAGGLFSRGQFRMDIFFILSGFFAAWRGRSQTVASPSSLEFFVLRMFRLLPLLWILTSAKLMLIFFTGAGGRHDDLGWFDIVRSYTMLPAAGYPVLLPAWTLSFELVFCTLLVSAALSVRACASAIAGVLGGSDCLLCVGCGQTVSRPARFHSAPVFSGFHRWGVAGTSHWCFQQMPVETKLAGFWRMCGFSGGAGF